MSSSVSCEHCGTKGRRRMGACAPEGWLYLEARMDDEDGFPTENRLIVWACSVACGNALWQPGPGKLFAKETKVKVLEPGREGQTSWAMELRCSAPGGCGALLLVEQADLLRCSVRGYDMLGDPNGEEHVGFRCAQCGVLNEAPESAPMPAKGSR